MKTIETQVFTFDELSDKAKEKVREWWLKGFDSSDAFDDIKNDAQVIGLNIKWLDDHGSNKGFFVSGATDCAQAIIENHGPDCETYKTAKQFIDGSKAPNNDEDANAEDFLQALLEDYRIMFNREVEYQQSDEVVDENIRVNDYTFTADGKRFG